MTNSTTRTHSLSPIGWIAVVGVCAIGLFELVKDPYPSTTLESVPQGEKVIVRLAERSFEFPILQARVSLPDGWTYLSATNPALATNPTFVNESATSVITLTSSYGVEEATAGLEVDREKFVHGSIDWFKPSKPEESVIVQVSGIAIPLRWQAYQHQRVGLMQRENFAVRLAVFAPSSGLDESIQQFCMGIEPIGTD